MRKKDKDLEPSRKRRKRPGMSVEDRENQLIALAVDLAEKQLAEGTASSQVITHYLKLGSTKERILEKQKELIQAKTDALHSAKRVEELYANALTAMRMYHGEDEREPEEDDFYE